eukprot:3940950-Rhodomonas_salina.2
MLAAYCRVLSAGPPTMAYASTSVLVPAVVLTPRAFLYQDTSTIPESVQRLRFRIDGIRNRQVDSATSLRACYAMSGTELAYGGSSLRACYAVCGAVLI